MVYKKYGIRKKDTYPNFIKFELNGLVGFSNGNHNFIFCPNELPFKNYQVGDEIEVNLTNAMGISSQSYHQEIVRKISQNVSKYDIIMMDDDYVSRQDEGESSSEKSELELISTQEQLSAYNKVIIHRIFRNTLEWLEKYIGVVYPNYQVKKQIYDNKIKREDANDPNEIEKLFIGALSGFKSMLEMEGKPPKYFYNEVKGEYYRWLGAAGIDVNNCPPRLKHFLFEINEILEGRGDKIEKELENRDRSGEVDPNSPEYGEIMNKLFAGIQNPLEGARNEFSSLKDKTDRDVRVGNDFDSDGKQAEWAFKKIAGKHDYQGFNFFPQKERNPNYRPLIDDPSEEFLGSSSSTGNSNTIQPNNPRPNVSYLTGQELRDNYVEVKNDRQLNPEQLGEIQRVENELVYNQNSDIPLNTAIPVAGGSLAFVIVSNGVLWFKSRFFR